MSAEPRRQSAVVPTAPVSVVVPCFCCMGTIRRAIASVAAQTLLPAEVILVEDCSGDGTLATLRDTAAGYPAGWITVVAQPANAGPSSARNRGWDLATQEYVAFLDADDSWHPRKIELQMDVLRTDPELMLLAHPMDVRTPDAPLRELLPPICAKIVPRRVLLSSNPFPTSSVVLRRALPLRFDEARWRAEDYLLWAQIVYSGRRAGILNQVLASWHKHPYGAGGLTADLDAMNRAGVDARRALHAQGLISLPELCFAHVIGALRHLRRHWLTRARRPADKAIARSPGGR